MGPARYYRLTLSLSLITWYSNFCYRGLTSSIALSRASNENGPWSSAEVWTSYTGFSAAQCTVHSLAGSLARTRVVGLRLRRYSPLISCPILLFLLWYIIKDRKIQNIYLVPYFCFWYERKKMGKIQNIYLATVCKFMVFFSKSNQK